MGLRPHIISRRDSKKITLSQIDSNALGGVFSFRPMTKKFESTSEESVNITFMNAT
ncbi:hypothetical protein LEP1GSC036_4059 [Leptospira weilii str. 2006001853]|uniref:Uncharacterized protein n=1 Tax=Leptospira weilii str. 2006001853 TaxID=1001589 RepID=A0A828Z2H1_9LEPT|nr:hypothetical protein LEP1GSC036_4059 [Leptospira weilii str. 2006001853]